MQPGNAVGIEAGERIFRARNMRLGPLLRVAADGDEQDVALADADALRALGGIELGRRHRPVEGHEPLAAQARDVEQNAAADDALLRRHDRIAPRAGGAHVGGGMAVVHPPLHEDVQSASIWLEARP